MSPFACPQLALMLTKVDFHSLSSDTVKSGLYILAVIVSKHTLCFFFFLFSLPPETKLGYYWLE